jgi:hypothetical protein
MMSLTHSPEKKSNTSCALGNKYRETTSLSTAKYILGLGNLMGQFFGKKIRYQTLYMSVRDSDRGYIGIMIYKHMRLELKLKPEAHKQLSPCIP